MHVRQLPKHVEVLAPAKVNLFLEVLARRPDGYHEIETVMVAVTIYDTLLFEPQPRPEITLRCRWAYGFAGQDRPSIETGSPRGDLPSGPQNLVWRAVELLRARAGYAGGAAIELIKRVPAAAGLGGASSDAAAALVAANLAWRLGWSHDRLAPLAAELGSDVPFFLTGGAAVCHGRGERIEAIRASRLHLVVVRPELGLSTPAVYARCRPTSQPHGAAALVDNLSRGDVWAAAPDMKNDLQQPAQSLHPGIATLLPAIRRAGAMTGQMSGSGSSCFGLCRSARHARRVAARLRARRLGMVTHAATAATAAAVAG
jgi:4-diphosphocytidyl-2-C-methyl-D-erythritol kinase